MAFPELAVTAPLMPVSQRSVWSKACNYWILCSSKKQKITEKVWARSPSVNININNWNNIHLLFSTPLMIPPHRGCSDHSWHHILYKMTKINANSEIATMASLNTEFCWDITLSIHTFQPLVIFLISPEVCFDRHDDAVEVIVMLCYVFFSLQGFVSFKSLVEWKGQIPIIYVDEWCYWYICISCDWLISLTNENRVWWLQSEVCLPSFFIVFPPFGDIYTDCI